MKMDCCNWRQCAAVNALIMLILLYIPAAAIAVDDEYSRQSLKGIKDLYVLVGSLTSSTVQAGFSKDQISRDVELKLRLGGINSLTQDQYLGQRGHPYLYVTLNALKIPEAEDLIVYYFDVTLIQDVLLVRDRNTLIDTGTWSIHKIGATRRTKQIRDEIKDFIDRFLTAHKMANSQQ